MESPQPPIKPEIVKTLSLRRQKSKFEQQLDSFKEELSLLQAQLNLFKTGLSECQHQTKKDHKQVKKLNKGFNGFIEDQGRANREMRTNMASLDTKQLEINKKIKTCAEFEQKNNTNQPQLPNIPKIIITPPVEETHEQLEKIKKITTQLEKITIPLKDLVNEQDKVIDEHDTYLISHRVQIDNLNTEQIRLNESITMLAENSTKLQDRLENNEKITQLLCKARGEVETEIIALKTTTSSLQRELIAQNALHEIEVQEFKTTIEKQKQSILNLIVLALLWYYSKK